MLLKKNTLVMAVIGSARNVKDTIIHVYACPKRYVHVVIIQWNLGNFSICHLLFMDVQDALIIVKTIRAVKSD